MNWKKLQMKCVRDYTILIMLFSCSCQAQIISLRFQSHINENAQILGDILEIKPDPTHLSSLSLETHPSVKTYLTNKQILQWLSIKKPDLEYQWNGKTRIVVEQSIQTPTKELVKKAQNALIKKLNRNHKDYKLKVLNEPASSAINIEDYKVYLDVSSSAPKRVCVWLKHPKHTLRIWFGIQYKTMVSEKSEVTVTSKNKHIELSVQMMALKNGYLGEQIWVEDPKTNKKFKVMVTGLHQAVIL